ncbi:uncharacterized protein PV09_00385 [Verruconis gallopava]|uniref:peptidyl-tRNA hydrolase n=1 Tax=Verruconis gallopava TaxID=253628 RepID=A0A0D2BDQ5_9PEZI|nr:uncharacterized protein PV09_00385 [Verruconis gallopava]KIW09509.1 hypothetical protein PV09_00385 [Verruconis gallopava]
MLTGLLKKGNPSRIPVFVASLGNPKPYLNTLHSAGHTVLSYIALDQKYDEWRSFAGGQIADKNQVHFSLLGGYAAQDDALLPTLWKCGALMNASGPAVKKAWLKWKQQNGLDKSDVARLVIVHDELEKDLGAISVRTDPKASARGHNGIKSVMASLPNERFIRIGVGIGRPDSRDRMTVSNYVLRKMTAKEEVVLENAAKRVQQQIAEIEEGAVG